MDKLIIDTDIGIDDAFALRLSMLTHELIGITTVNGNVTADMAVKNAKLFCAHYGLKTEIAKGASRPLTADPRPPIANVHGADGLGGVYANSFDAQTSRNAVSFLLEQVLSHPQEITIAAIAPLTNIAMCLNLCPEFASRVKRLIVMGGAFGTHGHTGNMSNFAEFNIYIDPEAADLVFKAPIPTVIVPLDVTYEVLLTAAALRKTRDQFLQDISQNYLTFSFDKESPHGMAVHDALTILYLVHPELFTAVQKPVRVSLSGITRGQTLTPQSSLKIDDPNFRDLPLKTVLTGVRSAEAAARLTELLTVN